MKTIKIYITMLLASATALISAQEISKEVIVTSNFKPEVEQAEKINHLPDVDDTIAVKPAVDINIIPSRIKTTYKVRPIKPAKIVSNPLDKLYNSYLKLGFGTQVTPLAEFSIHNLRSKKYAYGGFYNHKSSNRKNIEIKDNLNISDNYSINTLGGYGKVFFDEITLSGDAGFNSNALHYYGINPESTITNNDGDLDEIYKQRYSNVYLNAGANSNNPDSTALNYHVKMRSNYLYDKKNNKEEMIGFNAGAGYYIGSFLVSGIIDYNYAKFLPDEGANQENSTWNINPSVKKRKEEWEFKIGIKLTHNTFRDTANWYFYPDAYIRFYVIPEIIQVYFGAGGYLEENYFSKITSENPYFDTDNFSIPNTNHQLIGYGGIMGKFSSKGGYKIDVRFDAMDNNYFYVLKTGATNSDPENVFVNKKDNSDLVTISAETNYRLLDNFDFLLKAEYNHYNLVIQPYAWHKPKFKSSFTTKYNYHEKIYAKLDLIYIGQRYARIPTTFTDDTYETTLPAIFDINLGVEYKYSNVLSFFGDFYNILGNKYEYWHNYPTQGFNMMLGLSYKL